jgi:nuclear transcription factor Y gamma
MISQEVPLLFAKACELFALDLTRAAWQSRPKDSLRTLQRENLARAVARRKAFDFLLDVVPPPQPAAETTVSLLQQLHADFPTQFAAPQPPPMPMLTQQQQQQQQAAAAADPAFALQRPLSRPTAPYAAPPPPPPPPPPTQ